MAGLALGLSLKIDAIQNLQQISAVVVAGGQGSRVGFQQKALLPYQGRPIIESILPLLAKQVDDIWINANNELEKYQNYTQQVFVDRFEGFLGPLAGMQAAWHFITNDWIVFVPCDNPQLPSDFVERLIATQQKALAPLVVVNDGQRMQPLYLLMHRSMQPALDLAIEKRHLSVNRWVKENPFAEASFADCCPKAFQNMNTLEQYDQA